MARGILWIVLIVCVLLLAGCSVITRPPSAAAFMDSYREDFATTALALSMYTGDLVNETKRDLDYLPSGYDEIESDEWPVDLSAIHYFNKSHFTLGIGLLSLTPIWQPGFVSKNFGVMAWSNLLPLSDRVDEGGGKTAVVGWTGGISTIEQFYAGEKLRFGLTEHISKNGRESYWKEEDCGGGFGPTGSCMGSPKSIRYTEVGAGGYVSYGNFSLEFRYGRDISEDRNRFSVSLDWMIHSKKESLSFTEDKGRI